MNITKAKAKDKQRILALYTLAIEKMKTSPFSPHWEMGVHPTEAIFDKAIANGELYILESNDLPVSAMILNHEGTVASETTHWSVFAKTAEVLVLHLLVVNPDYTNTGYGELMVKNAISIARENKLKVLRLDVVKENVPARKLYEKCGFKFIREATETLSLGNTMNFLLYEMSLTD